MSNPLFLVIGWPILVALMVLVIPVTRLVQRRMAKPVHASTGAAVSVSPSDLAAAAVAAAVKALPRNLRLMEEQDIPPDLKERLTAFRKRTQARSHAEPRVENVQQPRVMRRLAATSKDLARALASEGLTWPRFRQGLEKAGISRSQLDLIDLAGKDPKALSALIRQAKRALGPQVAAPKGRRPASPTPPKAAPTTAKRAPRQAN